MKKITTLFLTTVFCGMMCFGVGNFHINAKADEIDSVGKNVPILQPIETIITENGMECTFEVQSKARGIVCNISVSIEGDKAGNVKGSAYNSFTLGFSEIPVYIILWSSSTTQINQTLAPDSWSYTADLNIFETVECSASTKGVGRYWQAVVYWNFDNSGWTSAQTAACYYDKNAIFVE